MKKIIYYTDAKHSKDHAVIEGEKIKVIKIHSAREAVIYIIDNINVVGIICDKECDDSEISDLMETVWVISPYLLFILFKDEKRDFKKYSKHSDKIVWIDSMEEIVKIEKFTPSYMRKFNRINWPLIVHFSKEPAALSSVTGNILSLSAGGAFIETDMFAGIEHGSNVYLIIEFKEFKLYVDSTVIRINKESPGYKSGFAVEFHHVSKLTQNCIDSIIRDRLASKLLFTIEDIF